MADPGCPESSRQERANHCMPDKPEPRFHADLVIRVFGMDANGRAFSQNAHAGNVSDHGARLSGLEKRLTPGDVVGVQFGDQRARCKVMWMVDAGPMQKIQAGVRVLPGQMCPWQKERERQQGRAAAPISRTAPAARNKRKFARQRVPFAIEIRDVQNGGSYSQAKTSDMAGSGCYVETMQPLPVRKILDIAFWLNSERVQTTAIVRTSDGGVGMGIEFTGLNEDTQKQLQQLLENLAAEAAPFAHARGAV